MKLEMIEPEKPRDASPSNGVKEPIPVIELSSSDSDDSDGSDDDVITGLRKRLGVSSGFDGVVSKKQKLELGNVLPLGFLDPLPPPTPQHLPAPAPEALPAPESFISPAPQTQSDENANTSANSSAIVQSSKQFWKAGDYEGAPCSVWDPNTVGMDHVRVHPKFLHSNATSHKWALGAFAELLDNALDEVCYGATYVNIDMVENKKDMSKMLLIEDNGGGMDPDKMRQCMSLGYSAKSKIANTIGQYGNGFKTSTMRLGADVIVFSRCRGKEGKSPTQSIGLLSYTFLKSTGKEDIVVPMLDYHIREREWHKMVRSSPVDWNKNVETIVQWSPFSSEADLLRQFNMMKDQGTRIIIYNLWEDDQGLLELDFDSDKHDIQIRGVNREDKNIEMAKQYPNSKHFLTYRHSLRSYASILYRRLPPCFRIILRGKDVEHHNIVNDMMLTQVVTYRPQPGAEGVAKDSNMLAIVTVGFVKDARFHIDVQGFNVYHKNRLIKPFWRLWNATGSDGRGVIGVLEADFVEPAHDKQGFERTTVLARLEARLVQMQKTYWYDWCHKIGYAPRRSRNNPRENGNESESSPDDSPGTSSQPKKTSSATGNKTRDKFGTRLGHKGGKGSEKSRKSRFAEESSSSAEGESDDDFPRRRQKGNSHKGSTPAKFSGKSGSSFKVSNGGKFSGENGLYSTRSASHLGGNSEAQPNNGTCSQPKVTCPAPHLGGNSEAQANNGTYSQPKVTTRPAPHLGGNSEAQPNDGTYSQPKVQYTNGDENLDSNADQSTIDQLREENRELKERLNKREDEILRDLLHDLQCERDKNKSLETQLQEAQTKIEEMNKEQESLIDIFSEERDRRDVEEENLRKKLRDATNTIQELNDKVKLLEKMKSPNSKLK